MNPKTIQLQNYVLVSPFAVVTINLNPVFFSVLLMTELTCIPLPRTVNNPALLVRLKTDSTLSLLLPNFNEEVLKTTFDRMQIYT